jgi:hypothetical protein
VTLKRHRALIPHKAGKTARFWSASAPEREEREIDFVIKGVRDAQTALKMWFPVKAALTAPSGGPRQVMPFNQAVSLLIDSFGASVIAAETVAGMILAVVIFNIYEHTDLRRGLKMGVGWRSALLIGVLAGLFTNRFLAVAQRIPRLDTNQQLRSTQPSFRNISNASSARAVASLALASSLNEDGLKSARSRSWRISWSRGIASARLDSIPKESLHACAR